MATQTAPTIEQLATDYGSRIAVATGITLDPADRTPGGFPDFLQTAADRLGPTCQTADALTDTANSLRNFADLTPQARDRRLREADSALWDAAEDLDNC